MCLLGDDLLILNRNVDLYFNFAMLKHKVTCGIRLKPMQQSKKERKEKIKGINQEAAGLGV